MMTMSICDVKPKSEDGPIRVIRSSSIIIFIFKLVQVRVRVESS